eukprot:TRINITY_DN1894_c0_g1_i1.p1 TRINITY_DN1894_c0_g1~~TRINITY_DN1894_c0_g1_i1.p1  ORF type:complete len:370 (+),score=113.62 TRINITY_DN1894_c0_g1_i1:60-1169(+)
METSSLPHESADHDSDVDEQVDEHDLDEQQRKVQLASDLGMMLLKKNQEQEEELNVLRLELEHALAWQSRAEDLESQLAAIRSSNSDAQDRILTAEFKRDEALSSLADITAKYTQAQASLKKADDTLLSTASAKDAIDAELHQVKEELAELRQREAASKRRESQLASTKSDTDERIAQLEAAAEKSETDSKQRLQQRDALVQDLQQQLERAKLQQEELSRALTSKDTATTTLSEQRDLLTQQVAEFQQRLQKSRDEIASLRTQLEEQQMEQQMQRVDATPDLQTAESTTAAATATLRLKVASLEAQLRSREEDVQALRQARQQDEQKLKAAVQAAKQSFTEEEPLLSPRGSMPRTPARNKRVGCCAGIC